MESKGTKKSMYKAIESQAQKKSLSLQNLTQQDSLMMDICFATFFNIRLCAAH